MTDKQLSQHFGMILAEEVCKMIDEDVDASGNQETVIDPKHPSYKSGHAFGSKLTGMSVYNPFHAIHAASGKHLKRHKKPLTLQNKLDMQRQFKAGAHAAHKAMDLGEGMNEDTREMSHAELSNVPDAVSAYHAAHTKYQNDPTNWIIFF